MASWSMSLQQGIGIVCAVAWMVASVYTYLQIRSRPTLLLAIHGCVVAAWQVSWPSLYRSGALRLLVPTGLLGGVTMVISVAYTIITSGLLIAAVLLTLPARNQGVLPVDSQAAT